MLAPELARLSLCLQWRQAYPELLGLPRWLQVGQTLCSLTSPRSRLPAVPVSPIETLGMLAPELP
ncbi:hypothetical protein F4827_006469, partial [Paraburkholderia bannensis]|nr:hypothetical protein [Paraburkholderia sp. WP4_3_2]MBB6106593.1 hypothetical protein [Paraburkholderia bannensis]